MDLVDGQAGPCNIEPVSWTFSQKRLCQGTITNREINLQEIELANDIDVKLLHIPGSEIEIEENEYNRRVATYISKKLK